MRPEMLIRGIEGLIVVGGSGGGGRGLSEPVRWMEYARDFVGGVGWADR